LYLALTEGFLAKYDSSELLARIESPRRQVLIHLRRDAARWLEGEKGDVHLTE
jgi:hypothetical protein